MPTNIPPMNLGMEVLRELDDRLAKEDETVALADLTLLTTAVELCARLSGRLEENRSSMPYMEWLLRWHIRWFLRVWLYMRLRP